MLHRVERADSFIQQELTVILRDQVHDPRVASVTITEVSLTRDRHIARVYVASFAGEDALREGLAGLESARGVLRRELARVLHWPWTPELEFRVDRSWQHGEKMDQIIDRLHEQDQAEPEAGDDDEGE